MAHNTSSKDLHINKQFTSVKLTGGRDCAPCQIPDLYVSGGAQIKKTLCLDGNLIVATNKKITGNLVGDLCGDTKVHGNLTVIDSVTIDKNLCVYGNIKVGGVLSANIVFDSFNANNVCISGNLLTNHIYEKTIGSGVTIDGVLLQDANITANLVCVRQELRTDIITPKVPGNPIQILGNVYINGGLIVAPNPFIIGGIESNSPFSIPDGSGGGCGCGGGGGSGVGWKDIQFPAPNITSPNWFATIVMGKTTLTCLVSGIYQVIVQGIWQQNSTGIRAIRGYSTPGFLNAEADATVWSNIAPFTQGATDMCVINAGDVVCVKARQTSGIPLNIVAKCIITQIA